MARVPLSHRLRPHLRRSGLRSIVAAAAWLCAILTFAPYAQALEPATQIAQFGHTVWRLGQGGLDSSPQSIAQTADGYFWIGTTDGLFRFDGVRFRRWVSLPGQELQNQYVSALLGARDGSLYVGTELGLARLNKDHLYRYPRPRSV